MDDNRTTDFLRQLYQMSGGDISTDVSMYLIGEQLGLDKGEAASLAEDIIIDGFAELKTLAGGVVLTQKGLEMLGKGGDSAADDDSTAYVLGENEILTGEDTGAVSAMLDEIRKTVTGEAGYDELEVLVIDIKTVEVQMLSSRPKTAIVKAVFASIGQTMERGGDQKLAAQIAVLIGER